VDHADDAVTCDQRGAEERLDPFLAQERIQYVGVVDVLDRQRPALVGDSAREAPAERDPHAALDLLLEPRGGPSHELAGGLVEEQEDGRVGFQDVADADEELVEQRLERQVRERRIGDEQELAQLAGRLGRLLRHEPEASAYTAWLWPRPSKSFPALMRAAMSVDSSR